MQWSDTWKPSAQLTWLGSYLEDDPFLLVIFGRDGLYPREHVVQDNQDGLIEACRCAGNNWSVYVKSIYRELWSPQAWLDVSTPQRSIWKPFIDTVWHFVFSWKIIQGQQTPSSHRQSERQSFPEAFAFSLCHSGEYQHSAGNTRAKVQNFRRYPICQYVYPWILQGSEKLGPL